MWRPRTIPVVVLAALALAGCGSTVQEETVLRVYVGAGVDADAVEGAQAALEEAGGEAGGAQVELVVPTGKAASDWLQAEVGSTARAATQDSASIAYIGEGSPEATGVSAPITNEAGLLQIAPTTLPDTLLAEPGGNDVPSDIQTTGERTLGALPETGADPGYAAMSVILDAIDSAEDPLDRADVVAAFLADASPIGVANPSEG